MIDIPPCQVVAQHLIDQSIGEAPGGTGWIIYMSRMPDTPAEAISVLDDDAVMDGRVATGERIEHPRFQVQIRGKDYQTARAKGIEVLNVLDAIKLTNVVVSTDTYILHNIKRTSSLIYAGVDPDTRLVNFTVNGEMTVSLTTP